MARLLAQGEDGNASESDFAVSRRRSPPRPAPLRQEIASAHAAYICYTTDGTIAACGPAPACRGSATKLLGQTEAGVLLGTVSGLVPLAGASSALVAVMAVGCNAVSGDSNTASATYGGASDNAQLPGSCGEGYVLAAFGGVKSCTALPCVACAA